MAEDVYAAAVAHCVKGSLENPSRQLLCGLGDIIGDPDQLTDGECRSVVVALAVAARRYHEASDGYYAEWLRIEAALKARRRPRAVA